MILNNYLNFINEISKGIEPLTSGNISVANLLNRDVTSIKDRSGNNIKMMAYLWGGTNASECVSRQNIIINGYIFRNSFTSVIPSSDEDISINAYTMTQISNVSTSVSNTLSLSGDKIINNMVISLTNNNAESVEIKSLGLIKNVQYCTSVNNYATPASQYILMAAKVLDTPITIEPAQTVSVNINWEEN